MSACIDLIERLGGPGPRTDADRGAQFIIVRAEDHPARLAAYGVLRRRTFVEQQGIFSRDDTDQYDGCEHTVVLVALAQDGTVLGGVRCHPEGHDPGLGWWRGSRLIASPGVARGRVASALVAAACAAALDAGALRFDARVQSAHRRFFMRLGWEHVRPIEDQGDVAHELMHWPIDRIQTLVTSTKGPLGPLLAELVSSGDDWLGDDGVPVPGSGGVIAATDAILPAMVDRDPEWAGWCGILVTANDLSAMGARPIGAMDAIGAARADHAQRIVRGLRAGAEAFDLPVLGGHTTLGVPGSLSVTGLGRTERPVPGGGGRVGDALTLTADLDGAWRPGYRARQWDSTSWRSRDELRAMLGAVGHAQPHAAKDVSMAGAVGTAGMLAEASACGAKIDVARVPRPDGVAAGDWLTCFPGFAMLTVDAPGAPALDAGPAVGARIGELVTKSGVRLRWPDGAVTVAVNPTVTGLRKAA
jgi:putative N-acetyltransferase (TIGR04045 family)